ncbi:ATP-grasp domain-containing protein [Gilvimarinus algae]|uniref:ATP-grasp domain-containing protein n=1 Tax=Gilvimarinus algae TaxID=3058037 RepID=A0ABT8TI47_9GAMM|nr:ATP-grasp domain-containing protein [Gilvimarinus sp. SDUM040014]MDO3381987.1 ATP-grasp domain-containing protein [Gilvimarinus sp. SDUM040014]
MISFNAFRTLGLANARFIKPELYLQHRDLLTQADWVLFPEYWQINALVYGLGCRIFPSLPSYLIGHNKIEMTRAFEMVAPGHTPVTLITANTDTEAERVWQSMDLPFVVKLPKASMGEGVWLVENRADYNRYRGLTDVIYAQEYLPIDRDIRVIVVGQQSVAAYWRHQSEQGFYNNVARGGIVDHSPVPFQAVQLALQVAQRLGVDHAGFDIAMVGSHPYLLEFNRLFGNQGIPGGGATLTEAISRYLADCSGTSPRQIQGGPIAVVPEAC